jgi:adenosylcobinamide kinase / adenosylcobinamide-phosphate guanylyltransferase
MGRIVLVTGGCRSGKSAYAEFLAEAAPGRRAYVATCPVIDDELRQRVERHRQRRAAKQWATIEEQVDLEGAIRSASAYGVVLVDCLTLWINNLMYQAESEGRTFDETHAAARSSQVVAAALEHPGTVIFVTNEVGLGVVPENAAARQFRDLVGRSNQIFAAGAEFVALMSCGIPIFLKGSINEFNQGNN